MIAEFQSDIITPVVRFTPDERYLVYPDGGNLARFPLDPDVLIALAESRVTRDFTPEECLRYRGPDICETAGIVEAAP